MNNQDNIATISELKDYADSMGVPSNTVDFDPSRTPKWGEGYKPRRRLFGRWEVNYWDHSTITKTYRFSSESEACRFLKDIIDSNISRRKAKREWQQP